MHTRERYILNEIVFRKRKKKMLNNIIIIEIDHRNKYVTLHRGIESSNHLNLSQKYQRVCRKFIPYVRYVYDCVYEFCNL